MKKINTTQNLIGALLMLAFFIFISGCKKDSSDPDSNEVYIQNMGFSPSTITVSLNTTVTWTNKDGIAHTVTSDSGLFDSGSIGDGQTYSHTFTSVGTYSYKCSYHSSMTGTVIVNNSTNYGYK